MMIDKFNDQCGVFGIHGHSEAAILGVSRALRDAASRAGERRHCRV